MRFECQPGCINCCTQKGFVYITQQDLVRIAEYLGMSAKVFERKYVYRTKNLLRLRVPRESQCHFLNGGGCRFALIDARSERNFIQRANAIGLRYALSKRIDGFNISIGRPVRLTVFRSMAN